MLRSFTTRLRSCAPCGMGSSRKSKSSLMACGSCNRCGNSCRPRKPLPTATLQQLQKQSRAWRRSDYSCVKSALSCQSTTAKHVPTPWTGKRSTAGSQSAGHCYNCVYMDPHKTYIGAAAHDSLHLQVGRARAHWQALRAEIQAQLQKWAAEHHNLPAAPMLWDVIVADQEGTELKVVPGQCVTCAQLLDHTADAPERKPHPVLGKENARSKEASFLAQKLDALDSIITRRRSMAKTRQVQLRETGLGSMLLGSGAKMRSASAPPLALQPTSEL